MMVSLELFLAAAAAAALSGVVGASGDPYTRLTCASGGAGPAPRTDLAGALRGLRWTGNAAPPLYSAGAGPGACARVACAGAGAGVWLCNDEAYDVPLTGDEIGGMGGYILGHCGGGGDVVVRGQVFDEKLGVNVLVGASDCGEPWPAGAEVAWS
ncbi:hypothetical protein F4780DRAFT_781693 [Xylariomycetidae sp. FL0641]|nr:hypothetical protein F4780DRAFT_781693 [Xylariomycetidae sp. FL0641]